MRPQPTPAQVRRAQRRLSGWPALAGLVLGAVLVLRLRARDDLLLTRDTQSALLTSVVGCFAAAVVLGLAGLALRRSPGRSNRPTGWWFAPAWVAWWSAIAALVASGVLGFWVEATTGDFWA